MEVRWALPAAEDLERICERIQRDNPEAARRVARTIYLRSFVYLRACSNHASAL